jgi:pimeloyl-ACP methyl ester carboxylesterase
MMSSTLDEEVTVTENFVLVHGAWHGGWSWQPVASLLRAAGHRVLAPTCPGLGINDDPRDVTLADCVDSLVNQVEESHAGDVTLVGHSWGGYVIAGAAPRLASRLARLVFWSAFVPETGRSLYDEVPPSYQELFAQLAGASADKTVALPLEVFQGAFMGDANPAAIAVVHSLLRPQPYRTFTDPPADGEAYRGLGIPLHYVLSADDVALPPGEFGWDRFAERIKATPVPVPGSHESMFTRPAELADALVQVTVAP